MAYPELHPNREPEVWPSIPTPAKPELHEWWMGVSEGDYWPFEAKLYEYGAGDLAAIGHDLAELAHWEDADDAIKAELGAYFYLRGKVARMSSAYAARRAPSIDSLHDITVYSMMLRRIRDTGMLA